MAVDDRRENDRLRARLDEIEQGYLERSDANSAAILKWGKRTTRLLIVLTVVLAGLGVWSVVLSFRQTDTLGEVQHSRQEATSVSCAVMSAVADAGRHVLGASQLPESPFTRFLEAHGYPSAAVREKQAAVSAERYTQEISDRVAAAVGPRRAANIVRADGTIDCASFARLVTVHHLK